MPNWPYAQVRVQIVRPVGSHNQQGLAKEVVQALQIAGMSPVVIQEARELFAEAKTLDDAIDLAETIAEVDWLEPEDDEDEDPLDWEEDDDYLSEEDEDELAEELEEELDDEEDWDGTEVNYGPEGSED